VPKSPHSFEPIPEEFDSADSFSIEGDVGDSERFLKHALALSETGYATPKPISEQLLIQLEQGCDPAEAVGNLHLSTEEIPHWSFGSISNVLSDYEAARLYVYRELTGRPDYRIGEKLDDEAFREKLQLHSDVSEKTITRIADTINDEHGVDVTPQLESVARELQDESVADDLLDPPEPATDGMDAPELVKLTRMMKKTGYSAMKLEREGDPYYEKWELFKPYELASHHNIHPNNARDSLRQKPYYWNRKTPTAKALWNQIRTKSRGHFRTMYICAFEQFLDLLDRYNLIPDEPAFAVDLTGWPWFGAIDDEDTPPDERKQPVGTEGTKPSRNYSHSWQFATISLVGTPVPMTFAARSVEKRNRRHYHLNQLLNYAEAKFDTGTVYLDKDFYTTKVKDELKQRDQHFIITATRGMDAFENLIMGTELREDSWNSQPYEIGVGASDDADHYLFVNPSEKRLKRADTGLEDPKNWEAYYTNIDPETVDGGGAALAAGYRLRWGIETAYRMLKHDFMPKSASPMRNQRVFLFNYATLLNNMWMGANVLAAANKHGYDPIEEDEPLQVKDDQGNYCYTANEFMTALVDDLQPIDIGEVGDLSEKSDILKNASGVDLTR
jgi:hypothetical protein